MAYLSSQKILIVDDDQALVARVKNHLGKEGYEVVTAPDGYAALEAAQTLSFDLVVLDINFSDSNNATGMAIDGVEVLRRLREYDNVPVLMLSNTNIPSVKVMALQVGADDYLTKPCELNELSARVGAILRRAKQESSGERTLEYKRLRLDAGQRRVWKDNNLIALTEIEFDILFAIARRPGHVYTRDKLIDSAWKENTFCVPKAVDVHIGHIRKKIEDDSKKPKFIITVRGIGFRFEEPGE